MGVVQNNLIDSPFLLWIRTELSQRMAQNLPFIKIDPERIFLENKISLNAVNEIKKIYPNASFSANFRIRIGLSEWLRQIKLSLTKQTAPKNLLTTYDLIWSNNLAIPKLESTELQIKNWHTLNAVDGLLMLNYLGPDTAREYQEIFASKPDIVDMHDFGDLLVHCGYSDPVMTMEYLKLEYENIETLLKELKALNLFQETNDIQKNADTLEKIAHLRGHNGKWHLTLEIVYGHAWKIPKQKGKIVTVDANSIKVKKK